MKVEEKAVPSAGTKKPFHPEPSGSSRDSTHSQQTNYSAQSMSGGLPPASAAPPQPHHREGYSRHKRINSGENIFGLAAFVVSILFLPFSYPAIFAVTALTESCYVCERKQKSSVWVASRA